MYVIFEQPVTLPTRKYDPISVLESDQPNQQIPLAEKGGGRALWYPQLTLLYPEEVSWVLLLTRTNAGQHLRPEESRPLQEISSLTGSDLTTDSLT